MYSSLCLEARRSCGGCVNATICRATTGKYLLQTPMLYTESSTNVPPCELYLFDNTRIRIEEKDVELFPNVGYYIQCPTSTCEGVNRDVYYEIQTSNVQDCASSGM